LTVPNIVGNHPFTVAISRLSPALATTMLDIFMIVGTVVWIPCCEYCGLNTTR
jgi:hypothetical protein